MTRVSAARLVAMAAELSSQEREVVRRVAVLKLVSHAQMRELFVPDKSRTSARATRRLLARLTSLGVLARLSRRVGGVRAGSDGYVYYLGPVGQRLIAYWAGQGFVRGRYRPEPGGRYVRHRLSVSQVYVDLFSAERRGNLDLLSFEAEPDCWRRYSDGFGGRAVLKPDAFIRVGIGAYEERCFVEVDLGTEGRSVVARKLQTYLDYFQSGDEQDRHGVFPRVVLLSDSEARRAVLVDLCSRLPAEHWQLFVVGALDRATAAIGDGAEAAAGEGAA